VILITLYLAGAKKHRHVSQNHQDLPLTPKKKEDNLSLILMWPKVNKNKSEKTKNHHNYSYQQV
jgi:hypothetical protein